jgi:hypothetical protein
VTRKSSATDYTSSGYFAAIQAEVQRWLHVSDRIA